MSGRISDWPPVLAALFVALGGAGAVSGAGFAQALPAGQASAPVTDAQSIQQLESWLTQLVSEEAGLEWNDDRHWGAQEEVWDGIRFRRDEGGRLETERAWKKVNHGSWQRYSAKLRPGPENFRITLPRIETTPAGESAITIQVRVVADIAARQSQWARGVQLYSLSAEGWADIGLTIDLTLTTVADWSELPPAVVLRPIVQRTQLELNELQLDRVSKVGGEVSQQIGRLAQQVITSQLEKKQAGLTERLNRQIAKHADRLRFSYSNLELKGWLDSRTGDQTLPPGNKPGDKPGQHQGEKTPAQPVPAKSDDSASQHRSQPPGSEEGTQPLSRRC